MFARIRSLTLLGLLTLPLPLALVACKPAAKASDAGTDAAPSASASETASDSAPAASLAPTPTAHLAPHFGPPSVGGGCNPREDTNGCSADHGQELMCSGGLWRVLQTCRGPGACKGAGSALSCDVGNLIVGDPCAPGSPPARCVNPHSVQQCSGGKWTESVCMPPSSCKPNGNGNQAACK